MDEKIKVCKLCGKEENDSHHSRYGADLDNPLKHEFEEKIESQLNVEWDEERVREIERRYQLNVAKKDRGHLVGFQTDKIEDDMECLLSLLKKERMEKKELESKEIGCKKIIEEFKKINPKLETRIKELELLCNKQSHHD